MADRGSLKCCAGLKGFMSDLMDMLQKSGLSVAGWPALVSADKQQGIERNMREAHNMASAQFKAPPQLIMVLLPTTGARNWMHSSILRFHPFGFSDRVLVVSKRPEMSQQTDMPSFFLCNIVLFGGITPIVPMS